MGAHQCGVPGCDWKFNADTNTNIHCNADGHCYCECESHSHIDPDCHGKCKRDTNPQTNAHSEIPSDAEVAPDSAAKALAKSD